jgi:hypothetical protein
MKKNLLVLSGFMVMLGFGYAQNDKNVQKKNTQSPRPAATAVKTETVILPDGTATVVTKPESTTPQRKAGKMQATEVKEIKTEPKKEN